MRIGIDLDDTIFCIEEQYKKYQNKFLKEKHITEKELWKSHENRFEYIKNNFDLIFSDIKVKKDASKVIKKLISHDNEIYILTARSKEYKANIYEFTEASLNKNEIPYSKLILTKKNKLESCINNNIDLMIDNSIDIYNELNGKINILLYDEYDKYLNIPNRVKNWKQIARKVLGEKE